MQKPNTTKRRENQIQSVRSTPIEYLPKTVVNQRILPEFHEDPMKEYMDISPHI